MDSKFAVAVGFIAGPLILTACALEEDNFEPDGFRLLLDRSSVSGEAQDLDLSKTPDPTKDLDLMTTVGDLPVSHLAKFDHSRIRTLPPGSALAATRDGVYEVTVGFPPIPEDTVRSFESQEVNPPSVDTTEAGAKKAGLSSGVDNRVRTIPDARLGMLSSPIGQCSAELIGLRLLRTAAHCVIQHTTGGGSWQAASSINFHYQRNGATIPVSTSASQYWVGGNYFSQNCALANDLNGNGVITFDEYQWGYVNNKANCANEDWALIVLPDNWWGAHGCVAFGFRTMWSGDVGQDLTIGGYPSCGKADSPSGCVNQGYYRDTSSHCEVKGYDSSSPDFRRFNSGCDISSAMSGGPVWERGLASTYFLGHTQYADCGVCASTDHNPNHFLGHNQWLFDFQVSLNNTYN